MTFEEFIGDRINVLSPQEYHAVKAVWDFHEHRISSLKAKLKDASSRKLPEGYALVPIKPSPRMIIDMAWWCRELSLSTGDLVEFWESMVESAQELDDDV